MRLTKSEHSTIKLALLYWSGHCEHEARQMREWQETMPDAAASDAFKAAADALLAAKF